MPLSSEIWNKGNKKRNKGFYYEKIDVFSLNNNYDYSNIYGIHQEDTNQENNKKQKTS